MKFSLFILIILSSIQLTAQEDLSRFQWKKRVLVITADSRQSPILKKQVFAIGAQDDAFEERKLVLVTTINPSIPFEIKLIGLDGGVKLEQTTILQRKELFSLIDGMPMRKQEIRNE